MSFLLVFVSLEFISALARATGITGPLLHLSDRWEDFFSEQLNAFHGQLMRQRAELEHRQ